MDPFKNHKNYWLDVAAFGLQALGFLGANKAQKKAEQQRQEAMAKADEQARLALQRQQEAQARVDIQRAKYESFKFENPYEGMQNPFEDLTVNQKAAQFQAELGAQQRADVLGGLRRSAGASGVAGLATALAREGTLQARQISTDIAKQEATNQALTARGTLMYEDLMAKGRASLQQAESGRLSTILGMEYGALAGANQAQQQAQLNQMYGEQAGMQMQAQNQLAMAGLLSDMDFSSLSGGGGGGADVDMRFTPNPNLMGQANLGTGSLNLGSTTLKLG
tara:strand:+ start:1693 stop:2529 length:837 start_codon:yes stop_codon:yes gene_type:complete